MKKGHNSEENWKNGTMKREGKRRRHGNRTNEEEDGKIEDRRRNQFRRSLTKNQIIQILKASRFHLSRVLCFSKK
uniref:Uncharacterized protein n=1 Tax=Caenorhabditis tropicalis TaxID=1561998 RepID=A0A1I7UFA2_9PELO